MLPVMGLKKELVIMREKQQMSLFKTLMDSCHSVPVSRPVNPSQH
jgi:hypothetical protein